MGDPIDFIYQSLRSDVIKSYTSGDFDNKLGQMNISIVILDERYDPVKFRKIALDKLQDARISLLEEVQEEVDKLTGQFNGFDITN